MYYMVAGTHQSLNNMIETQALSERCHAYRGLVKWIYGMVMVVG